MKKLISGVLTLVLLLGVYFTSTPRINAATVDPVFKPGNPTCATLGYAYELKIDPPVAGIYTMGNGTVTWTTSDNKQLDRTSTMAVDAVIVKGGNGANVYTYASESKGDTNLTSPKNSGKQVANISHVTFCYDYEVEVAKTANTSYTRQYLRTIEKSANPLELTLDIGEIGQINYLVKVNTPGSQDKDRAVAGNVSVYNPDPNYPANITSITDMMDEESITLDCGTTFPYTLNVGQTLNCTYEKSLSGPINTTNKVEVLTTSSSKVGGGIATADVSFTEPTTVIDDEVAITDSMYVPSDPRTCSITNSLPCEFSYTRDIGPFNAVIPDFEIDNVATVTTTDTQTSATANAKVKVTILPPFGGGEACTYTQGYRKTHSKYGPAPLDPTRAGKEDEDFFLSEATRYEVLTTYPKEGSAYYILAHQYIAAMLNKLFGATTTPEVDAAIAYAETFFNQYVPNNTFPNKEEVTQKATLLDQYNNGLIGPGHCGDEIQ